MGLVYEAINKGLSTTIRFLVGELTLNVVVFEAGDESVWADDDANEE